jgi:hypothetical protein
MVRDERKKNNFKTALVLGAIALFFFASVIVKFLVMD